MFQRAVPSLRSRRTPSNTWPARSAALLLLALGNTLAVADPVAYSDCNCSCPPDVIPNTATLKVSIHEVFIDECNPGTTDITWKITASAPVCWPVCNGLAFGRVKEYGEICPADGGGGGPVDNEMEGTVSVQLLPVPGDPSLLQWSIYCDPNHFYTLSSDGTLTVDSSITIEGAASADCTSADAEAVYGDDEQRTYYTISVSVEHGGCGSSPSNPANCEADSPRPPRPPEPPDPPEQTGGWWSWDPGDASETDDDDNSCGGGGDESGSPIDLLTGNKIERATDLVVKLPGRDFVLSREYTSATDLYYQDSNLYFWNGDWGTPEPGEVGVRWTMPLLARVVNDSGDDAESFDIAGASLQSMAHFGKLTGQPVYASTSGNAYAERDTLDSVVGVTASVPYAVDVWRVREPGAGERIYIANTDSFPTVTSTVSFEDLVGMPVEERDVAGNVWKYEWTTLGTNSVGTRENVRLKTIHLQDNADHTLARVHFDWNGQSGTPYSGVPLNDSAGRFYFGRLAAVRVERPVSSSWELTQSVRYLYFDDLILTDDTFAGDYGQTTGLIATYDGARGDLCEVITSERMDGDFDADTAPDFYDRVTQYRYYSSFNNYGQDFDGETSLDGAQEWAFRGQSHQLMAVFYPEQIEFYADAVWRASNAIRGNTSAVDDLIHGEADSTEAAAIFEQLYPTGGSFASVTEAAERLRWIGLYDDPATFHPQSTALLMPNGEWSNVLDLAGKVISYYTPDTDEHGETGRVRTQLTSVGASGCGCSGGAGSPFGLSRRLDYLYTRYKISGTPAWPSTLPEEFYDKTDGYSCTIVESYVDTVSPLSFEAYRVYCNDYYWASNYATGEVTDDNVYHHAAGAGIYKRAMAVCEADPAWDFDPYSATTAPVLTGGDVWATVPLYDLTTDPASAQFTSYPMLTGQLDIEAVAASASGYEPVAGSGSTVTEPTIPTTTTGGRVLHYGYTDGYVTSWKDSIGTAGTQTTIATVDRNAARPDLTSGTTVSTGPSSSEVSASVFGYHDSTGTSDPNGAIVAWRHDSRTGETEAQNGPSSPADYSTWSMFDHRGQLRWTRDEVGTLTYYEYDPNHGGMTLMVRDADPDGAYVDTDAELDTQFAGVTSASGWSLPTRSDYAELPETYEYDLLGRQTANTDAGGVTRYTRRELRWSDTVSEDGALVGRGVPLRTRADLPHRLTSGAFDGPIAVDWLNAGGSSLRTSMFVAEPASGVYDPGAGSYTLGDEVARSDSERIANGLVVRERRWHTIGDDTQSGSTPPAYSNDGSYVSRTEYDQQGRAFKSVDPEGGVTVTTFDLLGRAVATAVGTESSTPAVVARMFYDHEMSGVTPLQGVGDGNLTYTEVDDGTNLRVTERWFNHRNQLVAVKNPVAPHAVYGLDNLGRVVSEATFTSDSGFTSGTIGSLPDPDTAVSTRSTYTQTHYNNRGMVYRTLTAIDPTGVTTSNLLESDQWYDQAGRVIASWSPSSPMAKSVYDALGRPAVSYQTDRYGDAQPGGSGNYADAASVDDDHVLAQTEYTYVANGLPGAGMAKMVTTRQRLHDLPETTAGDGALSSGDSVAVYTVSEFDDASRAYRTLAYGTNGASFSAGTGSPLTSAVTTPLTAETGYDEWGRAVLQTSPGGRQTLSVLDPLSRQIAVVEARSQVDAEDIALSSGDWAVNWTAAYSSGPLPTDADRVTTFLYDGLGNVVKRTAHFSNGDRQTTEYVYGTSVGGSGATASQIASSGLLAAVHYPDETTGAASSDPSYTVAYGYNKAGEVVGMIDQNESTHTYTRDAAGRVVSDEAAADSGNPHGLDEVVDEVTTEFDDHGRVVAVRSLNGSTVVNAVGFTYTPMHQIASVIQVPAGDITSGDPAVVYTYSTTAASSGASNYTRVSSVRYPAQSSGSTLDIEYGTAGSIADRISRVSGMDVPGWTSTSDDLVDYTYLGAGMPVKVDYPSATAGLSLDYTRDFDGTDGTSTDTYYGFDAYGRVVWHGWVSDGFAPRSGYADTPNRTPLIARRYEYDADSNRTRDYDGRPGAVPTNRDWRYVYDPLDRLQTAYRGEQTPGAGTDDFTVSAGSLQWGLDILGNWGQFSTDTNSVWPVVWSNSAAERENRTHNMANEIVTQSHPGPGGTSSIVTQPSYDAAGNYRQNLPSSTGSSTLRYTHDLWNRLVRITRTATSQTVLENEYNGLNWRTKRRMDLSQGAYNGLDEARTYFYSPSWQLLEEWVDTDLDDDIDRKAQQFWGVRYIDDAVGRRLDRDNDGTWSSSPDDNYYYLTDAMFSVRGIADSAGEMHTRLDYTPYGVATHTFAADVDHSGAVDTTDSTIWAANANTGGSPLQPGDANYDPDTDLNGDGFAATFWPEFATFGDRYNNYASGGSNPTVNSGWIDNPTDTNGPDNSVGYDGYWFDLAGAIDSTSSGLFAVRQRIYEPATGRWLERDPAGYTDGLQLYQYASSTPTTSSDPMGLRTWRPHLEEGAPYIGIANNESSLSAWTIGYSQMIGYIDLSSYYIAYNDRVTVITRAELASATNIVPNNFTRQNITHPVNDLSNTVRIKCVANGDTGDNQGAAPVPVDQLDSAQVTYSQTSGGGFFGGTRTSSLAYQNWSGLGNHGVLTIQVEHGAVYSVGSDVNWSVGTSIGPIRVGVPITISRQHTLQARGFVASFNWYCECAD